jgi:hypothetical protein
VVEFCLNKKIENEKITLFWLDRWLGDTTLAYEFTMLYSIASDPLITIEQTIMQGVSNIYFTELLTCPCLLNFHKLRLLTSHISLTEDVEDQIYWRWNVSGQFKVHFLYEWLNNGRVFSKDFDIIWKTKIPFKNINIYVISLEE